MVTRVRYGFGSLQMRGNGSDSVGLGFQQMRADDSGSVGVYLDSRLYNKEVA